MDCSKAGRLICSLRREKGMTQRALADAMGISDRAVSKWERGMGFPDVSLLRELSEILGVNIAGLLAGELDEEKRNGGNMKNAVFYRCPVCGRVVAATDSVEASCCGRRLVALTPCAEDENHTVTVQPVEDELYLTINHDMTKQHYIAFVACVSYDRVLLVRLYPEQDVSVRLPHLSGGSIYYCCTEHGLFKV